MCQSAGRGDGTDSSGTADHSGYAHRRCTQQVLQGWQLEDRMNQGFRVFFIDVETEEGVCGQPGYCGERRRDIAHSANNSMRARG